MSYEAVPGRSEYPEDALLALGIPLGRQTDGSYGVRFGERVYELDATQESLWRLAHGGLSREGILRQWSRDDGPAALDEMAAGGLVVALTGDHTTDWARLEAMRPIPRAIPQGYDTERNCFLIPSPEGHATLELDEPTFWVWSAWDGAISLGESASRVISAIGLSPNSIRRKALRLACLGVFTVSCHLDAAGPGGDTR